MNKRNKDKAAAAAVLEHDEIQDIVETAPELTLETAEKPAEKVVSKITLSSSAKSEVIRERLGKNAAKLFLEVGDSKLSKAKLAAKQNGILATIDALAIKVGEKAVNLIGFLSGTAKLSVYTEISLNYLIANPKGVVAKNLIAHLKSEKDNGVKSYSDGTAKSQGHQMFKLLPALNVASVNNGLMKLNADSLIPKMIGKS